MGSVILCDTCRMQHSRVVSIGRAPGIDQQQSSSRSVFNLAPHVQCVVVSRPDIFPNSLSPCLLLIGSGTLLPVFFHSPLYRCMFILLYHRTPTHIPISPKPAVRLPASHTSQPDRKKKINQPLPRWSGLCAPNTVRSSARTRMSGGYLSESGRNHPHCAVRNAGVAVKTQHRLGVRVGRPFVRSCRVCMSSLIWCPHCSGIQSPRTASLVSVRVCARVCRPCIKPGAHTPAPILASSHNTTHKPTWVIGTNERAALPLCCWASVCATKVALNFGAPAVPRGEMFHLFASFRW